MQQYAAALGVAEEAIAKSDAFMRAFDQSREIGEDKFASIDFDDTELRMQCRKRVVGDLRFGRTDRSEKRRFPGIRQADETGIGDQLEAQSDGVLFARLYGIGVAWRPVG